MAGWCVAKAYKKGALLGAPFYNKVVGFSFNRLLPMAIMG